MSASRERILSRLRASRPAQPLPVPDLDQHYQPRLRDESLAERVARFRTGIESFHAEVHFSTEADWPALLARLCADKGVASLLYGADTPAGSRLDPAGFSTTALRPWAGRVEDFKRELFHQVDAGFTQTLGAIAETGTLILWPSAAEPRTLSLVPPIHFALLDARRIHQTFFHAIRDGGWASGLPTNALLVSGPSKTADIQQTLAYGAHGPKELVVIVTNAEGDGQ
ncbi:LutC/YkgG family protein [Thauera sp. Sel9]|uniref:LutC/YkgG family protein n=1 Tax=Thauera sp. Sel9 TaxID=2974299 RepID=UPI0021E1605E|nr:lactate utilization protein C [Thauera sp. Sel9]MCV2215966.1 lactate utilization protein C [Thauera sp. Sel9]